MGLFSSLFFGTLRPERIKPLLEQGAMILDVRSKSEFQQGHCRGAINLPLDTVNSQIVRLKRDKPMVFCCSNGYRARKAKNLLKRHGFNLVYNGGSWKTLARIQGEIEIV